MTRAERKARRERAATFLRRAGSIPEAQRLAKREGWGCDTSVWIGALGDILTAARKASK